MFVLTKVHPLKLPGDWQELVGTENFYKIISPFVYPMVDEGLFLTPYKCTFSSFLRTTFLFAFHAKIVNEVQTLHNFRNFGFYSVGH